MLAEWFEVVPRLRLQRMKRICKAVLYLASAINLTISNQYQDPNERKILERELATLSKIWVEGRSPSNSEKGSKSLLPNPEYDHRECWLTLLVFLQGEGGGLPVDRLSLRLTAAELITFPRA